MDPTLTRALPIGQINSYLLADETLDALCDKLARPDLKEQVREMRDATLAERNAKDGKDIDDLKSSSGMFYLKLRNLLAQGAVAKSSGSSRSSN